MAWLYHPLPSSDEPRRIWRGTAGWIISARDYDYASVALATWDEMPVLYNGGIRMSASGLASDDARWYYVSSNTGWSRSTDGLTGLTWVNPANQTISASAGLPGAAAIAATPTGRLVALAAQYICVSDNGGDSWAEVGTTGDASPGTGSDPARVTLQPGGELLVITGNASQFWRSTDNGSTWAAVNPGASPAIRTVARIAGGYCVTYASASEAPRVSLDNGSTWAALALSGDWLTIAAGTRLWLVGGEWASLQVRSTEDLATWSITDTADLPLDYAIDIAVGDGRLVLIDRYSVDYGVYSTEAAGGADPDPDPDPSGEPVALPLRLAVHASPALPLPLRLSVGTAGAAMPLPLRLAVLDGAVLGGLDGAGGWAAAPDGRWQAVVVLGDDDISAHIGPVSVQIAADAARTAQFAFRPVAPLQPLALIGRRVRIAFAQSGGQNAQTVFQGVVDVPSIDLQTGLITCACTDQAQEVWTNTAREAIDALVGGRWHVAVSGEPEDNYAYMRERIQSVAASWALDVQQRPCVLPWRSPARSVTVLTADVIDGSLSVDMPSREQLRSRITCRLQYRYPVLRWRVAQAQYSQPVQFFLPTAGVSGGEPSKLWLTRGMVESATDSVSGWEMISRSIESPPARSFVLGSSGAVYAIRADVAPSLAIGFQARYRARWRQSVTEDYTVTVTWPWLESQLPAPVGEEFGATLDAPFDVIGWDSDASVQPQFNLAFPGDHAMPWQPAGYASTDRDAALATLLDRAWVRLWGASRSGRVNFALPCRPDMWLDWRVTLEHASLRAAGDVVELEHTLDNQTGEAITAVSLAVGLPGNTAHAAPTWPSLAISGAVPSPAPGAYSFEIGTYVGGASGSPPFNESTMIGFATNFESVDPGYEYYPHQLSIRAPALSSADRDPATAALTAALAVDVPTDLLEITA